VTQFAIYSTDIDPTTDPASANPAPATLVVFPQDPIFGDAEFDEERGAAGRGSHMRTLGGVVVQDFGPQEKDGAIYIADRRVLVEGTFIADMRALHDTVDGEYYFTEGLRVWKVRFARPDGFRAWRDLLFKIREAVDVWSYEINLLVVAREI